MGKNVELGRMYGKLLVIKRANDYVRPSGRASARYLCLCACGKTTIKRADYLLSGHATTCGCEPGRNGGRKSGSSLEVCFYEPLGVICNTLECNKCGWNPHNKELRKKRIMKLERKDGTDE